MRIAIVGAGLTGLSAAHFLSEDARHVTTVFETRARFGGLVDERFVADSVGHLFRLGVTLRRNAQVERLLVDDTGADVWINGLAERFDLALVTTSSADARALLARSGIRRHVGSVPLRKRVYFSEHGAVDPGDSARAALARMALDHPAMGPRPWGRLPLEAPPRDSRIPDALRSLARRASGLTAAHVEYLDLSGHTWPLDAPAVYIANQRWILDVVPRHLMVRSLRTPKSSETNATATTTAGGLEASSSVAFVVEGGLPPRGYAAAAPHGRGAALAALALNAPIVPIAATGRPATTPRMRLGRPRARVRVVIGEPFYPETSSIDELMDDMCMVVRHLERLAIEHVKRATPGPVPIATDRSCRLA
jgi:hypothetical protein